MGPQHKDVINEAPPAKGRERFTAKEVFFKATHVKIGVRRCHSGAHGGAFGLEVVLVEELKVVFGEDETGQVGEE